ncbi:hypothetical protein K438DRAFT_1906062 [Mycena galopus ATCC 62051]|nr:hypothetical protein K438DRAFT_1906062 [Mycena galopus ATCC 62051]
MAPIAAQSDSLKTYMSSHPATLVGYAKWYGKVEEPMSSAQMSAIDSKSMTLACTLQNGSTKVVAVVINPPFKGYDDVKPRLLEMKAVSQEGLGLVKPPRITSFHLPPSGYVMALFLFTVLPYGAFAPSTGYSPLLVPAHFFRAHVMSQQGFRYLWWVLVAIHLAEGAYTLSLCSRYRAPLGVSIKYFITTFFIGFPTWMDLRQRIRSARIEGVMKVE